MKGLFLLVILICSAFSQGSLSAAAQTDIQNAVQAAIMDGLSLVESTMRAQYWYYLSGAKRVSFRVAERKKSLEYTILFLNVGGYFRAVCSIDKVKWVMSLYSFSRIGGPDLKILP